MSITFQEHMKDRTKVFDNCVRAKIGKDFAVFEFECKFDLDKALEFAKSCNKVYKYVLDSNLTDKFVCFNKV